MIKIEKTFCISTQTCACCLVNLLTDFKHILLLLVKRMIDKIVRRFCYLRGWSSLRTFLWKCFVRFSCSFDWLTSWLRLVVTQSRISFWSVLLDWISLWISFWLKLWNDLSTIILKRISIFICWFWGEVWNKIDWRKYWYRNTNWIELGRGYWFWEWFFWFC